ncbi:MAG: glycoside hydrolase family 97 N-terminal domain-containing protein, partial [Alistipes sp.]|nr:glycoside hydrolase family 97 N-terminal domain-containing protein [Alistipes sp.]
MKKIAVLMLALCSMLVAEAKPTVKSITSPDGKLKLTVTIEKDVRWSVELDGETIIAPSKVAMQIGENEVWGENPRLRKATTGKIDEVIPAPLYKKSEVVDQCSTLTLSFVGNYGIEFRAYNEAAAYRFTTTRKGDYTVKNEVAEFSFEKDNNVYCSYVRANSNKTFEQQYFNSFE